MWDRKSSFIGEKNDSVAYYLPSVVLVEINIPTLSVLWGLCVIFSFECWHVEKQESKRVVFSYTHLLMYTMCTQLRSDREKTQVWGLWVSRAGYQQGRRTHSKTRLLSFFWVWVDVSQGCKCSCMFVSVLLDVYVWWFTATSKYSGGAFGAKNVIIIIPRKSLCIL